MNKNELKSFLNLKADQYNSPNFIKDDPISIPHRFQQKRDIEISGFLMATIAWGNRKSILNSGEKLMQIMGNSPYDFVLNHEEKDLNKCSGFVHRTFNEKDLQYFLFALKQIYNNYEDLESCFFNKYSSSNLQSVIHHFKIEFLSFGALKRTHKHISDPLKNSAAKRLNMMLRWFVRQDNKGVDLGIWTKLKPSDLSCPLDVHSGRVARKLGLLKRKQNDGKAVMELDKSLRRFDKVDPAKYDFALFGLGVYEGF